MAAQRPSGREEFEIAIICALPQEYNAVSLLFDNFWDEEGDQYGRAAGDPNNYTTGCIGKYNVVLALLSHIGKANAAGAAASIRSSYPRIRLALLVGICGGVPRSGNGDDNEILLGDVVISKTVVQYDFGRQYPNTFARKDTIHDNLGKPNKDIRNLLATFETDLGLERLQQRTAYFLGELQANAGRRKRRVKYNYPGTAEDKLFESNYRHKHYISPTCICSECHIQTDPVCIEALNSSCDDLGCDDAHLVAREPLERKRQLEQEGGDHMHAQEPAVYVGAIASGDTVMKCGVDRDRIANKEGVIAFEMEGAGIWEEVPCIIIKGICDYADSHKQKRWQNFAAATAASASKAILERYIQTDRIHAAVATDSRRSEQQREDKELEEQAVQKECLRSLHFENMNARFDTLAPAHETTLQWVWNKHSLGFVYWLHHGRGVYWITGRPGSGKSTLMKYLVDNENRLAAELDQPGLDDSRSSKCKPPLTISYFFDFRAGSIARSIEGLLRSLIWQLLRKHKPFFKSIINVFREMRTFHSSLAWSRHNLESSFINMVSRVKDLNIVVFIDALDEFGGSDVEIAEFVDDLARRGPAHIRFCVASRPYPDFAFQFQRVLCLRLHERTSNDIDRYLHARLLELRNMPEAQRQYLITTIKAKAEGIFLWIKLVSDEIHRGWKRFDTFEELLRRIDQMPTDLRSLYRRIFDDLSDDDREQAYRMLALVTYAKRPLTILEFYYALGYSYEASIRLGHSPCSCALCRNRAGTRNFIASVQLKLPNSQDLVQWGLQKAMRGRIYAVCRGLIDVHIGHLRLLHETVSAFWPEMQRLGLASTHYQNPAASDSSLILAACTEFLATIFDNSKPVFTENGNTLISVSRGTPENEFYTSTTAKFYVVTQACQLVLLNYALQNWIYHARVGDTELEHGIRLILSRLSGQAFAISSRLALRISGATIDIRPADMLEMAISLRLRKYVMTELRESSPGPRTILNSPQTHHTAHGRYLFAVARLGDLQMTESLLNYLSLSPPLSLENGSSFRARAMIEGPDKYRQFALHRAIYFGHIHIVELLLRYGADQTVGNKSPNLTQWLELGSTIDLEEECNGVTESHDISSFNRLAETRWCCEIFWENHEILGRAKPDDKLWGPTVASVYEWANTPLQFAIRCNYKVQNDSFHALLSAFSLGHEHPSLGHALIAAAFHGLTDYVEELLGYGVDPDFTSHSGTLCSTTGKHACSALISAIFNGHFAVADLLLDYGSDPNRATLCSCGLEIVPLEAALSCWDTTDDSRLFFEHALSYIICLLYKNGARVREQHSGDFNSKFPDIFQDIDDVELETQIHDLRQMLEEEKNSSWPAKRVPPTCNA